MELKPYHEQAAGETMVIPVLAGIIAFRESMAIWPRLGVATTAAGTLIVGSAVPPRTDGPRQAAVP